MKRTVYQLVRSAGLVLVMLLVFSFPASADENSPEPLPDLFSSPLEGDRSVPVDRTSVDTDQPEVIRSRPAEVDFSLLESAGRAGPRTDAPAFRLNLFEDAQFSAFITHTEIFASGAVGLVGTVESEQFNELVMVSQDGALQAYLQVGQQAFEIRFTGAGHLIVEVDQSTYPDSLPPVIPPQPDNLDDDPSPPQDLDAGIALDSGSTIDVLAVYTPAARVASGGTVGIETKIQTSILSSNQGYADSGINQRLNLVEMEEVSYNENPSGMEYLDKWNAALNRLTGTESGYLADARAYRETYGADLVFMITSITGSTATGGTICGIGWVAGDAWADEYGYSVVNYNCAGNSAYTPQHEMGHNMGACHDWNNTADSIKPYCYGDYSYGYQQLSGNFYTVMAYSPGSGYVRLNRWSNPDITYNGYPTSGLVSGQTVYPNNALTLNNTAYNVANWRQSVSMITGEFTAPEEGGSLLYPRTHLGVTASSAAGAITSVAFYVQSDGIWQFVETDTEGADGWEVLWNSSGVAEQNVALKAVVTDSTSNTKELYQYDVPFMIALTSVDGYQSRTGGAEVEEAVSNSPGELLRLSEEAAAVLEVVTPEPEKTAPVIVEPVQDSPVSSAPARGLHQFWHSKILKHRWMMLY
ncbi:MAG: hypothetical protein JW757_02460 [Anaerolineales bacterium]|nr:hypothetical protein [Anaerolineales bacterium]